MNLMRRSLIMFGTIVAIPVILVLLLLGRGIALQMMGYPVDIPPSDLAEAIAAEGGDPLLCRRLQQTVPTMGPSLTEKRMLCFYLLAQKLKDPSVCELLMPTDYGFSCLGAVSGKLFAGQHCTRSGSLDHVVVYCNRESEGEVTIDRPQIDDCSLYERRDLREWCFNTRTELRKDAHECNRISHPIMYDECEYNYALKQRDPSLCSPIKDEKRRDFCTLYVELSVKYR